MGHIVFAAKEDRQSLYIITHTNGLNNIELPHAFEKNLFDEFRLRVFGVELEGLIPVLPGPAELEVGQVVGEPGDEPENKTILKVLKNIFFLNQ